MTRSKLFVVAGGAIAVAALYLAYDRFAGLGQENVEVVKECSSCTARHRALIESKKKWEKQGLDTQ